MNNYSFSRKLLIFFVFTFLMTAHFISIPKLKFAGDSEVCVTGMIGAGVLNLDVSDIKFGMNAVSCDGVLFTDANIESKQREGNSAIYFSFNAPNFASHNPQIITTRKQQLGIQGWFLYFLGRTYDIIKLSPKFYFYFTRAFYAFLLALVVTALSFQINKAYNNLMAVCFYCSCFASVWIIDFAANLYFVPFTWYLPMLFGLMAMNYPDKRILFYFLVFLSVCLKSLCGYEHVKCVMMCSVLFSSWEYFKNREKLMFRITLGTGLSAIAGFFAALIIHAYIRGSGNIINGLNEIYYADVIRSTYGHRGSFILQFLRTTIRMFTLSPAGWAALILLLITCLSFYSAKKHNISIKHDLILFLISFSSSFSWILLANGHTKDALLINYVLWYMPFIPVCVYVFTKQRLFTLIKDTEKQDFIMNNSIDLIMKILYLA